MNDDYADDEPLAAEEAEKEYTAMARDRYEPPGFLLMMEILKLLSRNGKITMTVTLSTPQVSDDDRT